MVADAWQHMSPTHSRRRPPSPPKRHHSSQKFIANCRQIASHTEHAVAFPKPHHAGKLGRHLQHTAAVSGKLQLVACVCCRMGGGRRRSMQPKLHIWCQRYVLDNGKRGLETADFTSNKSCDRPEGTARTATYALVFSRSHTHSCPCVHAPYTRHTHYCPCVHAPKMHPRACDSRAPESQATSTASNTVE